MGTDGGQDAAPCRGASDQARLLRDLFAGRTSRNRDFERFRDPAARRVLSGYRRLLSLARELAEPGVEASVERAGGGVELAVEVRIRGLGYHRLAVLTAWEFALLREEMVRRKGPWSVFSRFPDP